MVPASALTLGGVALVTTPLWVALGRRVRSGQQTVHSWRQVRRSLLLVWGVVAAVVAYALLVERGSLAFVYRLPPDGVPGVVGLFAFPLFGLTMLATTLVVRHVTGDTGRNEAIARTVAAQPWHRRLAVAATAGVGEEFLFRGYLVERLLTLTGSPVLAGTVSVVAFVGGHAATRSRRRLLQLVPGAAVLVVVYLVTRSLPAVVVAHGAFDAAVLLSLDAPESG